MFRHATLVLLGLLLCFGTAAAQSLSLSLNVSAHPNPYLSEWEARRETAILTVTNLTGASVRGKLHARVLVDGTLKAETNVDKMPVLDLAAGVSNYFADEIIPNYAVTFYGNVEATARRTGMLPAGNYELCVELLDAENRTISQPVCRMFFVTSYQLPILLQPAADATIDAARRPIFRWTPVVPVVPGGVVYRVLLFEVLPGQYPMQAFRANQPIMDIEVPMQSQLIWPAEIPLPDERMQYVWTVQALTMKRDPVGEREGFSEPVHFTCDGSVRPGLRRMGDGSVKPGDGSVIPGDGSVKPGDGSVIPGDGSVKPGDGR
jgi:hypothetical protein